MNWLFKKKETWAVFVVTSGLEFYKFPKDLPLPRIDEMLIFNKKTYRIKTVLHIVNGNNSNEVQLFVE